MKNLLFLSVLLVLASCISKPTQKPATIHRLPSPAAVNCAEPYLFADDSGIIHLSWVEKAADTAYFRMATLQDAIWRPPVTIAQGTNWFVNWADFPMVAANGSNRLAHYLAKSGEGTFSYDVWMKHSADGGATWGDSAQLLNEDGKEAEHGFVTIVPYEDNFLVSWLDGRGTVMEGMEHHEGHHGQMSLRAAILDRTGRKVDEWELDNRTCDCCQTTAAITSKGPIIAYRDRSEEEIRDMSIVRFVNGAWTEPKNLFADNWKIEGCPVNGPRMDAKGDAVAIAWFTMAGNEPQVKITFSADAGESFGEPIRIDEGKAIGRLDLAMLSPEVALVTWMEGGDIRCAKIHADGTKEPSILVAQSSEARSSGFPQLTVAGDHAWFAWTNPDTKSIEVASLPLK